MRKNKKFHPRLDESRSTGNDVRDDAVCNNENEEEEEVEEEEEENRPQLETIKREGKREKTLPPSRRRRWCTVDVEGCGGSLVTLTAK